MEVTPTEKTSLKWEVHKYSSFSSNYVPENVKICKPKDQSSRWSSDSNNPPQYLTLKLEQPAIVQQIMFGKFEKAHVCNIKKFSIYGGLKENSLLHLLDSGLKNDSVPELFALKHKIDGNYFPCRYIKIVPLQTWGQSFNFSIWYIRLDGIVSPNIVMPIIHWYDTYREREAVRLCLKHLRQRHLMAPFHVLQQLTNVTLEHETLTKLYQSLVEQGDYKRCEELISSACEEGLFTDYIIQQNYQPQWTQIEPLNRENDCCPGMRGGHQMCVDCVNECLYLFGGWDGQQDLADFWIFNINSGAWSCVSQNTELEGGPSARSCHKMCLDQERKQLFTLGRYLEPSHRVPENLKSDFYVFDIECNRWTLVCEDTSEMGGPKLMFDHQMSLDSSRQTIYVFGGRILSYRLQPPSDNNRNDNPFSGLYTYHIPTSTWVKLRDDCAELKSRIGHSMLLYDRTSVLYIFAGQRDKEYLGDLLAYHIDSDVVQFLSDGSQRDSVPAAGYTQRATIDQEAGEIHVFSGLSKDKDKKDNQNSFWIYNIEKDKWSCIYKNENIGQIYCSKLTGIEPIPRFAHQLVYDQLRKRHFLFGGNPGQDSNPQVRLDDFWSLKLIRPSVGQLERKCRYLIREHYFKELARQNTVEALYYLQTQLSDVVDHNDPKESENFQCLASSLFQDHLDNEKEQRMIDRSKLFDQLVSFFPELMTQPTGNLVDLVHVS